MVSVGMLQWVSTYVVHSTALIVVVWGVTTLLPRTPLALKETLWKVALFGGIFTASLQMAAGTTSPWGEIELPQALGGERTAAAGTPEASALPVATAARADAPAATRRVQVHDNGGLRITATREKKTATAPARIAASAPSTPAAPGPWRFIVLGLLAAGSLFAVLRLVFSARRLRAQLRSRRDVIEDPVLESFLTLCQKAELKKRPRLTASPHLRSPVALPSHEICLPERAVDSLTPPQQEGMLAHEIAHLQRRDPMWQIVTAVVEAVFFFQPLNHLARRKVQEVAEYQCDDWAARHTGTGVHLAKCLAEVAGWVEDGPPPSPLVTAMASDSSPIVRRIKRLLHHGRKPGGSHPIARVGATLGALGLITWLVPGVGVARAEPTTSAPVATAVSAAPSEGDSRIAFLDIEDDDHDRSRLRFESGDEIVEVEVDTPRAQVPEPPARDEGSVNIVIRGGVWGSPFGCCDGGWHGFVGVDLDGIDIMLEGLLGPGLLFDDDPGDLIEDELHRALFGGSIHEARADALRRAERARERAAEARERAEHARERAERARERAHRHAERARARFDRDREDRDAEETSWFSLMGGAPEPPPPPPEPAVIEL